MTDQTTLKASVLVSQLSDVVQNHTHNFLHNSVAGVEQVLAASSILVISCSGWNMMVCATAILICGHINLHSISICASNTPVNRCPDF